MVKSVFEQTARIGNRQLKTSVYFSFYAVMGDGGPGMQSTNVAVWLVNFPYRQSTDNAASVNAMVTHWKNRFIWRRYCRKNNQWFDMVCTLTDNDIRQNSGQNCRFVKWTWCKEIQFADVSVQSLNSCSLFIIYESVKKKNTTNKLNYTKLQYCCHSKKKVKSENRKKTKQELICT